VQCSSRFWTILYDKPELVYRIVIYIAPMEDDLWKPLKTDSDFLAASMPHVVRIISQYNIKILCSVSWRVLPERRLWSVSELLRRRRKTHPEMAGCREKKVM